MYLLQTVRPLLSGLIILSLTACGGSSGSNVVETPIVLTAEDNELTTIIDRENLTGDATSGRNLPLITDTKALLGKKLFFAKNLGGEQSAACVFCHHPVTGGGDNLSLPVGVDAVNDQGVAAHNLIGLGRFSQTAGGLPLVPRNAPTVFNTGLWDSGLFWDSRIQSTNVSAGANGTGGGIVTPDSSNNLTADASLPTAYSLPAAQSLFPVTSVDEMRDGFELGQSNQTLRASLTARLQSDANWVQDFNEVYGDNTVSFERIGEALGEYERSMVFIDNPWKAYIDGDTTALTEAQKRGAILFFTPVNDNGAGCSRCHSGDFFTDEGHHVVAFPQLGVGKGNDSGNGTSNDFGRENISNDAGDRFHFRTPSLLNIAVTAPYGHAGAYQSLAQVVAHYDNPNNQVDNFFGVQGNGNTPFVNQADFCDLPQIAQIMRVGGVTCATIFPNAYEDSQDALQRLNNPNANSSLLPRPNLNGNERADVVAFLEALTDPCVLDRDCLNPWIIDGDDVAGFPDTLPLVGEDADGVAL